MFFLIEFVLCAVAVLAAFFMPNLGEKWFLKFERPLNRLAQHRGRTVLGVGLLALALRGALLRVELCGPGDRSDLCPSDDSNAKRATLEMARTTYRSGDRASCFLTMLHTDTAEGRQFRGADSDRYIYAEDVV